MKSFIKILLTLLLGASAHTVAGQATRFHNEESDTIRINSILREALPIADPNERVAAIAKMFVGTPYKAATLESDSGEMLTVNLDEMDCTTFVDNVIALAYTAGEGRSSWRDFAYNLERLRYRGGKMDGYTSRLHYISEWIVDNIHRGNFDEVTGRCPDSAYEVKTIDYMSANRALYPPLADDSIFQLVKSSEIGYRSHRFPIIKAKNVGKAAKSFLKEGDIVALTTATKGLDVSHMGIVTFNGQKAYLLHASSKEGKIVIDKLPLTEYIQRNRSLTGLRVIRLKD